MKKSNCEGNSSLLTTTEQNKMLLFMYVNIKISFYLNVYDFVVKINAIYISLIIDCRVLLIFLENRFFSSKNMAKSSLQHSRKLKNEKMYI